MPKPARHEANPLTDRALMLVVMRFVAYFVLFMVAILLANAEGAWRAVQLATAALSTTIASGLGVAAMRSGTLIELSNRTLSVDLACTAVIIVALYSSLVLAYPVSSRQRLIGLGAGIPLILFANIGRIVAAIGVAARAPSAFQFFHDYLFQVGMVFVTVAIWTVWLSFARRDAR